MRREESLLPSIELLLGLAGVGEGMTILDIAARSGEQPFLAARRVGPSGIVLATDIAEGMLAPESCDAVISRFGLMFMPRGRKLWPVCVAC